jgi:hypothetical protein
MTSWPIEEYHKVMDYSKPWIPLDSLLCMALQDTIDRTQRGNRLEPLLLQRLLDGCSTSPLAAWPQGLVQRDDALDNRLRGLIGRMTGVGTPTRCPPWVVGPVARFPLIEPTFGPVQVAAERLNVVSSQIARHRLLSAVFLRVIHRRLLMRLTGHPVRCDLFSMSWHDVPRWIAPHEDAPGTHPTRARGLPLTVHSSVDDSAGRQPAGG